MAKSREELITFLKASFNRDNTVSPGSMTWRSVFLATVDQFNNKQYNQARSYVLDMSLSDLRTCKDVVEDMFIDEFLAKLESHFAGINTMTQAEIEAYELELNELLPPKKLDQLAAKTDELVNRFTQQTIIRTEDELEDKPKRKNKKQHDAKN